MILHRRINKTKCSFISVVVAIVADFITAQWLLSNLTCAYTSVNYRFPRSNYISLHKLMMSAIPSITSNLEMEGREIIKGGRLTSTAPVEQVSLDFFSAVFGAQTTLGGNAISQGTLIPNDSKTKRQNEMWDYIQAGLGPYYAAVYGLRESWKFKFTIASSQDQMPLNERILKAAYEESFPWLVSIITSSVASVAAHSLVPLEIGISAEVMFLLYCAQKVVFKFNVPTVPQPMLGTRDWKKTQDLMWSSYGSIKSKRNFIMGYFYNVPFEKLRKEDALAFLAWVRFGTLYEFLPSENRREIDDDLLRLDREVGVHLSRRNPSINEQPLPIIRFNLEHLRFRHKPLPFYGVTHGVNALLAWALPQLHGFSYHPPQGGRGKGLGYWYRPPSCQAISSTVVVEESVKPTQPLVFVHGVGGMCFYYGLLEELARETDGAIVLLDLPFVSLRIADEIPTVLNQIKSIESILDEKFGPETKVSFAGHSFGSIVLSWMVQVKPERVANCVFIDPVCFQQHLSKALFNFHLQRVDKAAQEGKPWLNPISIGALMNLAGSEMHTNNAMLRHYWWNTNALWPEDIEEKGVPTCVLLSERDEIVPSREVHHLISEFNRDRGEPNFVSFEEFLPDNNIDAGKVLLRSFEVVGANHGELLFNPEQRKKVIQTISSMLRLKEMSRHAG